MQAILKRALFVALLVAVTVTGAYLHAEEKPAAATPPVSEKLKQEYRDVHKQEYLKKLAERENYYSTMAAETKALRKACLGDDKAACKAAKEHEKATKAKLQQTRKAASDKFKNKMQEYRTKMGKAAPNAAEKDNKAMKAKKDDALE
jgi:hypothetical protein